MSEPGWEGAENICDSNYHDDTTLASFRLSERVLLRPGDQIRLKAGPYTVKDDGSTHSQAERGRMVIDRIEETERGIILSGATLSPESGCRWAHVSLRVTGETIVNDYGTTDRPYRVTKCRQAEPVQPFPIHIPKRRSK